MVWNVAVFALVGLLAGGVAYWSIPRPQPLGILATLGLGLVGSLPGGLLVWYFSTPKEGPIVLAALLVSVLGAVYVIGFYAAYARRGPAQPW